MEGAVPSPLVRSASPYRTVEPVWLRMAKVLVLLTAIAIIFVTVLVGSVQILVAALSPALIGEAALNAGIAGAVLLTLGLLLGGALTFQTVATLARRPSTRFWLPSPFWFALMFCAVVVLGTLLTAQGEQAWPTFIVVYILGMVLPAGWIMSAIARRLTRTGVTPTWRETILQLSSGAFLSTSLALLLEAAAVLSLIVILIAALAATPQGSTTIQEWADRLQAPGWLDNPQKLQEIVLTPLFVFGMFFVLSIVVPMIEELFKAVGVVLMSYRHPTIQQALWWGLLGGAGFGVAESLLNGNMALGEMPWSILAPLRFGTTLLHCLTGALMGLGWHALLSRRRFWPWLKRYVQAVVLHGIWNGLTIGLLVVGFGVSADTADLSRLAVPGLSLFALLIIEIFVVVIILGGLVQRVTQDEVSG